MGRPLAVGAAIARRADDIVALGVVDEAVAGRRLEERQVVLGNTVSIRPATMPRAPSARSAGRLAAGSSQ